MKVSAIALVSCLATLWVLSGCSKEEELPPPRQTLKVLKSAAKPEREMERTAPVLEEKKSVVEEEIEKKKAGVEEKTPVVPRTQEKQKEPMAVERDYYVVKEGDTLSTIAARKDVYADPLKWPLLLRFNLDQLNPMPVSADFAERGMPAGTRLKIVTSGRPKAGMKKGEGKLWVVNVFSSTTNEKIAPLAVTIVRIGYPAYITRANVKGQDWLRLRVGFFAGKAEADEVAKRIMETTNFKDTWITIASQKEYEEFGGF